MNKWLASAAVLLLACMVGSAHAQSVAACTGFTSTIDAAGDTNGNDWPANSVITVRIVAGTATSLTWNLVGSASGTPIYSGPHNLGDTATFTTTYNGQGVGYYVLTTNGTATATVSCSQQTVSVPATSPVGLAALAALLALFGFASLHAVRARRR